MKHLRLYEYYSELPLDFSADEIKKMTEDEFLNAIKKLKGKGEITFEEQIFTYIQIWKELHPESFTDMYFLGKLGNITGNPEIGSLKQSQKDTYQKASSKAAAEEAYQKKSIKDLENKIRLAEENLRMDKEKLAELKSRGYWRPVGM
jgi:hypothetical protein